MYLFLFFWNGTATHEIYSYLHKLYLPDALQISRAHTPRAGALPYPTGWRAPAWCAAIATCRPCAKAYWRSPSPTIRSFCWTIMTKSPGSNSRTATCSASGPACRSEEHSSELQSLMRISYAVFCLKKKKHTDTTHQATDLITE